MAETAEREEFVRLTGPYWREVPTHWHRASPRTWLHPIATTTCLTAPESRGRPSLPSGLVVPSEAPEEPLRVPVADVPWLRPLPYSLVDPAAAVKKDVQRFLEARVRVQKWIRMSSTRFGMPGVLS